MNDAQIIERPETGAEVAILGTVTAVTVFGTDGGVDAILEKIRAQARAIETDISTEAGRRAVASLAYKIARSKTALDGLGKELGEANYRAWRAITAERARIETELDALRDEVRKPLSDWENADKARVAAHEAALAAICETPSFFDAKNTVMTDLRQRLAYLEQYPGRDWQEFSKRAADALEREIAKTKVALAAAEKREAEAAETARLAQEKMARERAEREALIAANARREAEEKARQAAEAEARRVEAARRAAEERAAAEAKAAADKAEARARKAEEDRIAATKAAEAERARIEWERQDANRRADEAEAARLAATAKARADMERAAADAEVARKKAAEDAVAAERQRIADAQVKDAADTAAREANRRHRAQINGEARDALVKEGISEPAATAAISAIARGAVPHTRISY